MLKYEIVKQQIIDLINDMHPDDMIPSYSQLAEKFNVSDITVRKALTELTVEGVIYSQRGKGSFVAPKKTELKDIHVVSHHINVETEFINDFYPIILEKLQTELMQYNFNPIYSFHKDMIEIERHILKNIIEKPPFGVVCLISGFSENFDLYKKLSNICSNLVFLDNKPTNINGNIVCSDSIAATYELFDYVDLDKLEKIYITAEDSRRELFSPTNRVITYKEILDKNNFKNYEILQYDLMFEEYKYLMTDYIRKDIKNYKRVGFLQINSVHSNMLLSYLQREINELDFCQFVSFGEISSNIPRNTSVIWAKQDVNSLAKNVADLIKTNSKETVNVIVPFKIMTDLLINQ